MAPAPVALAIAAATLAIQNGILTSFAVLYLPLVSEFKASRADVAAVQSAVLLLGGFAGPLVGWAFDRLGPRRLFHGAALLGAVAFAVASRADSLVVLAASYGVLGGLALAALGSQANMLVAALWYPRARGRAIAIVDLGTGLGAFALTPVAQALVERVGWRGVLLAWAAVLVVVVIPLNAFQRRPGRGGAAGGVSVEPWTTAAALRRSPFWWLAAVRFFGACAFPVVNVHMVAYAIGQGIPPAQAAAALGAVSMVSLVGRITTGWLADRIGRPATLTLTYGSAAIGIACLAMLSIAPAPRWLAMSVLFYGLAQGSAGIIASARAADLFAGPSFGTIWGWLTLAVGPGEALGAWLGGRIFDTTGSYLGAFAFAVAALVGGVVAIWRVRVGPAPAAG